ncbi:recombination protein O N-terminal domain-containing protein [Novosphingobium sp.]|uniref:DNA repair protein RecO n=1 Tax=Novosphingobium sp. TaxID=1874826 RepID=UPI0025EFCCEB|nr:recombination protein O N-terminal domain-containing protein [Novosphingobium sp.]MCC6924852.1 recombination protein O N-terminal domain-containing protein [Novosphingobium sp.]
MHFAGPAIVCASRPHGETAVVVRLLTEAQGLVAGYVAGGRGRQLRPVLVPGNLVEADLRARIEGQLPFARLELLTSRGPWLSEPLPAAAIGWATALTAAALPERHAYPALFPALSALLDAVCHAPSARGWLPGLLAYEALLLRELGYGETSPPAGAELPALLAAFDALGQRLDRYPLAERRNDVMGARAMLRERLARLG